MLTNTAEVAKKRNLSSAMIIDDAYDLPTARWVSGAAQAFINQLRNDAHYITVGEILGVHDLDEDQLLELLEIDHSVQQLYEAREQLPTNAERALFGNFEDKQNVKVLQLQPIEKTLEKIGVNVFKRGGLSEKCEVSPDLVIIDLFLDDTDNDSESAADLAAEKLKPYLSDNDSIPVPLVVLVSSREPDLRLVNERFRVQARVPGCRFAFITKNDFANDHDEALFRLYQLFDHADNSAVFDCFTRQISTSAADANDKFVRLLERFELSDYADLIDLVVKAEGIPLRQYLLDLFALSWASFVESNVKVSKALRALDKLELTIDRYPPNELEPSDAVLELYEQALYRHGGGLSELENFKDLGLGDILQGTENVSDYPNIYLVIVQDCDQSRGNEPDSAFLIEGKLAPLPCFRNIKEKAYPYTYNGQRLVVSWDVKSWRTVRPSEFNQFMADNRLQRLFQLRPPWSLSYQSAFFQHLSRPAEMAIPFAVHAVDLQVIVKAANGQGIVLVDFDEATNGFLLAGRRKDAVTRLVMSSVFAGKLRAECRRLKEEQGTLNDETKTWIENLLNSPSKLQALRAQLELNQKGKKKPQTNILAGTGIASSDSQYWKAGQNLGKSQDGQDYHLVINISVIKADDTNDFNE